MGTLQPDKHHLAAISSIISPEIEIPSKYEWVDGDSITEQGQGIIMRTKRKGDYEENFIKKVLKNAKPTRIARFAREIKVMVELNADGFAVAKIEDGAFNEGKKKRNYYVMPYYKNKSLESYRQDNADRFADPISSLAYYYEIAVNLRRIHERTIFHRDLKPANILIDDNGKPVFCDFGLCVSSDYDETLTETGEPIGSRYYSPPEADGANSLPMDEAHDTFAMGKILYFILVGDHLRQNRFANWKNIPSLPHPDDAILRRVIFSQLLEDPTERKRSWEISFGLISRILYPQQVTFEVRTVVNPAVYVTLRDKTLAIQNHQKRLKDWTAAGNGHVENILNFWSGHSEFLIFKTEMESVGLAVSGPTEQYPFENMTSIEGISAPSWGMQGKSACIRVMGFQNQVTQIPYLCAVFNTQDDALIDAYEQMNFTIGHGIIPIRPNPNLVSPCKSSNAKFILANYQSLEIFNFIQGHKEVLLLSFIDKCRLLMNSNAWVV